MRKKKGRYQHNDKKAVKREYMSYEDVPINDYEDCLLYTSPSPRDS